MIKYYLITLLLIPVLSIAQNNYKSGYVVNLKGDTLHGFIDYKEWGHNPKNINFKSAPGDKARLLGLSDISHFEIEGYVAYHKYKLSISTNSVDISSAQSVADTSSVIDTVFLKILQTGDHLTLFSYKDKLKSRFYIKENTLDAPMELIYGIYQDNNTNSIVEKNDYKAQLSEMVIKYKSGSDKLIKQVQQSAYREYDLIPVAAQINGYPTAQSSVKAGKDNPAFRFFIGGAFSSGTLKTSVDQGSDLLYGAPPTNSSSPKITIGVDAITNPDVGHLIFRLEFAYSTKNYTITGVPNPLYNIVNPEVGSLKLKQNSFSITPQVIYNIYNAPKLKVFIDLGYAVNVTSYPVNDLSILRGGTPIGVVYADDAYLKSLHPVFQLKAGVVLNKRFEIYGAYFSNGEITASTGMTMNVTSYQFGLNYFWSKVAH